MRIQATLGPQRWAAAGEAAAAVAAAAAAPSSIATPAHICHCQSFKRALQFEQEEHLRMLPKSCGRQHVLPWPRRTKQLCSCSSPVLEAAAVGGGCHKMVVGEETQGDCCLLNNFFLNLFQRHFCVTAEESTPSENLQFHRRIIDARSDILPFLSLKVQKSDTSICDFNMVQNFAFYFFKRLNNTPRF